MMHIRFLLIISFIMPCAYGMMGNSYFQFYESESSERKHQQEQVEEITTTIRERIDNKLDLDAPMPDWHEQRPLHRAIYHDPSGKLALKLLEAGANPNVDDGDKETPLHWACHDSRYFLNIEILLKYKANPNVFGGTFNQTPLHLVCVDVDPSTRPQSLRAIKLLLAYGADPLAIGGSFHSETPSQRLPAGLTDLANIIDRIYNHKKAAYLLLLKGKDPQNSPLFGKLPTDLIKLILNINHPGWPLPDLEHSKLLSYLEKKA